MIKVTITKAPPVPKPDDTVTITMSLKAAENLAWWLQVSKHHEARAGVFAALRSAGVEPTKSRFYGSHLESELLARGAVGGSY